MSEAILRNRPEDEVARLVQAAREALTDSMVERLSISAGNALEVLDRLNDEGTREAVLNGLDRLTELHRIGALDTLFDLVGLLHAARAASTDSIVERLFAFAEHMVNTVGSEEVSNLAINAHEALDEAAHVASARPATGGLFATLSMLSRPATQRSLTFLLAFSQKLMERTTGGRRSG